MMKFITIFVLFQFGVPYYARVTQNACKGYADWIKTKKVPTPIVVDEEAEKNAIALLESNEIVQ